MHSQTALHLPCLSWASGYGCSNSRTHLAKINTRCVRRRFNGQHGRSYLFDEVVNVIEGEPYDRQMTTGKHVVCDISCCLCGVTFGWKYDNIYDGDPQQKYRKGKFILERSLLVDVE
ncbi:yippee-like protein [Auriscalpium vulgare]|uniref:Yippee-like protein n=1 Tax=Auriscalpium vulgare TaxID=40419 RepID=A0ACB8RQG0_9AGAM|nr:yippee-like protein [Auriscalpium vulgare]